MINAGLQTLFTIIIPIYWAIKRLDFSLSDLGINTDNLGKSILFGCVLYSLALAVFISNSDDPFISEHAVAKVGLTDAIGLLISMAIIAAGTDIATRGFILFTVARYVNVPVAIILQNFTWYIGHIVEINWLTSSIGYWYAVALTLTLGLLGDVIALKLRNIVGLAIAHILLNIILVTYIRYFL